MSISPAARAPTGTGGTEERLAGEGRGGSAARALERAVLEPAVLEPAVLGPAAAEDEAGDGPAALADPGRLELIEPVSRVRRAGAPEQAASTRTSARAQ
jgi:hypothetical protein